MGDSPFADVFEKGGFSAYAGREDQMERQRLALERARTRKLELLDREFEHGEEMAKKFKVPYQPKQDWVGSAANAASTALGIVKDAGLFQRKDNSSITRSFTMKPTEELRDAASRYYTPPNFDASKAFYP